MAPKATNGPKRAKSAYLYFQADKREEVKREMPELKASQMMQELAKRWKTTTSEEREPYERLAAEDKQRYQKEKEEFGPIEPRKRGSRAVVEPKAKRAPSAYNLFLKEKRAQVVEENPDMPNKDVMTEVGRMWKEASAEEKAEYNQKAKEAKENMPAQPAIVSKPKKRLRKAETESESEEEPVEEVESSEEED
ncbi:hypothetical protein P9112_009233 [Eukaryota sp. TZLM1-RC]